MSREAGEETKRPKEKVLLHTCCGPCATAVIEKLSEKYEVICFFYNPNIHPHSEYELRLKQARQLADQIGVRLLEGEYDTGQWFQDTAGLEGEPEGGRRCGMCFRIRLDRTALKAREMGLVHFATTLTISPHKKASLIDRIGEEVSERIGVPFLFGDWKKADGFRRSLELSREHNLLRQDYCGCKYSRRPV